MRRRRARRSGGIWFPLYGENQFNGSDPADVGTTWGTQYILDVQDNGSVGCVTTIIQPLLPDFTTQAANYSVNGTTEPLADIIGNEYFIKRLVGKLHIATKGSSSEGATTAARIAAGFFIARSNGNIQEDLPVGCDSPLLVSNGSTAMFESTNLYSPLSNETIREPWIWRRSWILANQQTATGSWPWPSANNYGSVMDGPHIDAKTKRRVKQDDRLWFALAGMVWPTTGSTQNSNLEFYATLDLRMFASPRRATRSSGTF